MDHSLRNAALEINRLVTEGRCSLLCFMAHAAADCHILSFNSFTLPTERHWLSPLRTRCSALLSSCRPVLATTVYIQFIPLDPCHASCTPPRSAPWQSTIAQGMQINASLFCILKKTVCVLSERMSCLHCSSVIVSGFSCQENWPRCSPLYDPHSSLQILQADTLAPPVAFGLC